MTRRIKPTILHYERMRQTMRADQIIDATIASGDSNSLAYIIHTNAERIRKEGGIV